MVSALRYLECGDFIQMTHDKYFISFYESDLCSVSYLMKLFLSDLLKNFETAQVITAVFYSYSLYTIRNPINFTNL